MLIDLNKYPVANVLELLLKDKTTKENIVFATDNYAEFGAGYSQDSQMTVEKLRGFDACEIQPRVYKSLEAQKLRTKVKAEVMTPGWIVCKMNAYADEEWFGRPNVFETLDGTTWSPTERPIEFPEGKTWTEYVDSRRIEITCGEAPYIVSRYDVTTGDLIPLNRRIGLLDRKLRIVCENTSTEEEWLKWALRAFQSVYGYEYQGDNLLIARINLLNTYVDYMREHLHRDPSDAEIRKLANVIVWNFWQMDGLTGTVLNKTTTTVRDTNDYDQVSFFDMGWEEASPPPEEEIVEELIPCKIKDWRSGATVLYNDLKRKD